MYASYQAEEKCSKVDVQQTSGVCLYVPVLVCMHVCVCVCREVFFDGIYIKWIQTDLFAATSPPSCLLEKSWRSFWNKQEQPSRAKQESLQDPKQNVLRFPHTKHQYIYRYIWPVLLFIPLYFILKYLSIHCTSVHLHQFFLIDFFGLPY